MSCGKSRPNTDNRVIYYSISTLDYSSAPFMLSESWARYCTLLHRAIPDLTCTALEHHMIEEKTH